jgi:hypothetical protein
MQECMNGKKIERYTNEINGLLCVLCAYVVNN